MGRNSLFVVLLLLSLPVAAQEPDPQAEPPPPTPPPAPATGTIIGIVLGAEDGAPLADAEVVLVDTGQVVRTDSRGAFIIADVAARTQEIEVSHTGYQNAVLRVDVIAGREVAARALLSRDPIVGDEVVVTGSRFPEKRLEAPVTVERVDEEEVATTGGSSYLAALAMVKGIDFANTGINEKRVSARGFNTQFNSRMLTMVDGRLAQLPGNGLPQGALLPTSSLDVRAVEVVVGPASALYGANAHTGVINVITKTPWDQSGLAASARVGTNSLFDVSGRAAGTLLSRRFGWKLTGQYLTAQDFTPDRAQRSHHYGSPTMPLVFEADLVEEYATTAAKAEGALYYRDGALDVRAGYGFSLNDGFSLTNAGRNHILGWQVHYQTLQLSHPNWFAQVTRTASDAGRTYQLDRLATLVQGMELPDDASALDPLREQIKFVDQSQLYDAEVQYRAVVAGGLKLTAGTQLRVYLPYSGGTYLEDGDGTELSATEIGGYGQLDYPLLPGRLRVVGAARVDTHSNYPAVLSPKAAVVWTLRPTHHVRAGYNRAFKSPTILESYLNIGGTLLGNREGFVIKDAAGTTLGTIDPLEPEVVDAVELGYKGAFGTRVVVDAVGWYSWYENFISPLSKRADPAMGTFGFRPDGTIVGAGTPGEGTLFTYANFGRAEVGGADLSVEAVVLPQLVLQASGSLMRLVDFESGDPTQKDLLLNVPELKWRAGVSVTDVGTPGTFLRVHARWQAAYAFESGRWSSAALIDGGEVPSRLTVDAVAGWRGRGGLAVSVNVFNLLDDRGVDVLGAPPGGLLAYLQLSLDHQGLER